MRTSLNEIKAIEDHLFKQHDPQDSLLFQAHLVLNSSLPQKIKLQQGAYEAIQQYSRKQLKQEIAIVQQKLEQQPQYHQFIKKLRSLFTR